MTQFHNSLVPYKHDGTLYFFSFAHKGYSGSNTIVCNTVEEGWGANPVTNNIFNAASDIYPIFIKDNILYYLQPEVDFDLVKTASITYDDTTGLFTITNLGFSASVSSFLEHDDSTGFIKPNSYHRNVLMLKDIINNFNDTAPEE